MVAVFFGNRCSGGFFLDRGGVSFLILFLSGGIRFNSLLCSFSRLAAEFQFVRVWEVAASFQFQPFFNSSLAVGKRLSW